MKLLWPLIQLYIGIGISVFVAVVIPAALVWAGLKDIERDEERNP